MTTRRPAARKPRKPAADAPDVYQQVTDQVIALMESGVAPWARPWTEVSGSMPLSMSSGKPYRGMNVFTLHLTALAKGYTSPWWGTYRQITERGGQVRKDEKSTVVFYWKRILVDDKNEPGQKKMIFFAKTYRVFNADQADGLALPTPEPRPEIETIAECEQALKEYYADPTAPTLHWGGDRASYSPSRDAVSMPARDQFTSSAALYGTWFHETVHSTGHQSRLARKELLEFHRFGDESYSKEELVAEMGAAFLSGMTGIATETLPQSAAYLASWISALKGDKKLLISAAAQAQKAAELILGVAAPGYGETEAAPAGEVVAAA